MSFSPDIPGAYVVPSPRFWAGRKSKLPVSGVVQHYTASLAEYPLVKWMASSATVSAHIFIYRNGTIVQMVKFSDRALHAGETMDKGFWSGEAQPANVNHFTIGIENCNAGWLLRGKSGKFYLPKKRADGSYTFGKRYRGVDPVLAKDHNGKERWWEPYSDALIESNIKVLKRILELYPELTADLIQSHSDVSPHRKFDPGPLWPHQYIQQQVFGLEEDDEDDEEFVRDNLDESTMEPQYDEELEMCFTDLVDDQ